MSDSIEPTTDPVTVNKHWRRAGELISLSSLGGKTAIMVQHVLCAALQWAEDERSVTLTHDAAHDALGGSRRKFDDAKRLYEEAISGERATRDELLAYVHALETKP